YGALRTRQVFDLKPDQVTKLVAGNVTVERDSSSKWKLVAPAQGVLDNDGLQHLLDAFCQLRAEEFARPRTDADAGLGTTIQVTASNTTHWLALATNGPAAADACELTFKLAEPVVQTLTKPIVTG